MAELVHTGTQTGRVSLFFVLKKKKNKQTDLGQHTKLLHKVNASKTAIFTDIAITGLFVMVPAHLSVLIVQCPPSVVPVANLVPRR